MSLFLKFQKGNRGLGYKRISHILTEKGYRSVRTNSILKNSYIYTIYSKGKIRESRIERSFDSKNSNKKDVESILFSFDLIIRTSKLTKTSHYNTYQYKLYRLIKFLKEERGIGYRRISHILTEKGYRSIRTNSILKNNYIYSIYKKGKIRESRIERGFDSKIVNLRMSFN